MRKIRKILACLFAFIVMILGLSFVKINNIAAAEGESVIETEILDEIKQFVEYGQSDKSRKYRVPGSKAEYNSANYLKAKMSMLSSFKPVENQSTKDGVQSFEFQSDIDGMTKTSQNIIFQKKTETASKKKVVLSAHYDSAPLSMFAKRDGETGKIVNISDGISENASSVATILCLAKALDRIDDLGFTLEIVFFGASNNSFAGAKEYMKGVSDVDAKNILAMINLERIGVGQYNYFYVNEFENSQFKYAKNVLSNFDGFKALQVKNVLHTSDSSMNGLEYSHIGIDGEHALFMERNINIINFFSGFYENLITPGIKEYENKNNVTYTGDDTYDYIIESCPGFSKNLANVYAGVKAFLTDDSFVSEMEKNNGSEEFYGIYKNEKLAVFVTILVFAAMCFVYILIFHVLQNKSKKTLNDNNLDKIVIKIAENIGDDSKEISELIDQKLKDDTDNNDENDENDD